MPDLKIQICYAEPDFQLLRDLTVAEGTTIQQAIMQSGILRVEIYRPLIADPKETRRLRAELKARKQT
jgi:putative ubiquitin-RnfH superfamily antitoxin RatB of RatAB toxin-antitoxin module